MPDPAQQVKVRASAKTDVEKYSAAANRGDPDAQNKLGNALGDLGDFEQALKWYHTAAAQGWPNAVANIGAKYANGEGVTRNLNEAAKWWGKAVDLDFAPACFYLGSLYFTGDSVAKNHDKAVELFIKGAKLGHADCALTAGEMYGGASDSLLKIDYARAADCFRRAIQLKYDGPEASQKLAVVERNLEIEKLEEEAANLRAGMSSKQKALDNLNSNLASAGGFRCPSCGLHAGAKIDTGTRGKAFAESLTSMGSPFSALMKTYKCMSCGYIW